MHICFTRGQKQKRTNIRRVLLKEIEFLVAKKGRETALYKSHTVIVRNHNHEFPTNNLRKEKYCMEKVYR